MTPQEKILHKYPSFPDIYQNNLTETEILELAGYHKMYDCGMSVWIKE